MFETRIARLMLVTVCSNDESGDYYAALILIRQISVILVISFILSAE